MQRRNVVSVGGLLIGMFCSCASNRIAHITRQNLPGQTLSVTQDSTSRWVLDSLAPDEKTVLIQGETIPVSIHLSASGNGNYLVEFSANRKRFRPFMVGIVQGPGMANFSGAISWFLKIKGRKETETISVSLFGVENSASGKTEVKTLLKQFNRKYDVVCNKKTWPVLLFLERHLGLCSCKLVQ